MFYSKILICAAEIQKLKPEFKPVLSSLTYLIHVHLFIYHLHPQFSSPGHSHQAGHLWRGISHSQRAMADGGFGSWNMCFLGFWEDRSQRTTLTLWFNFLWDTGTTESKMRNVASKEPWLSQKNGFSIHTILLWKVVEPMLQVQLMFSLTPQGLTCPGDANCP